MVRLCTITWPIYDGHRITVGVKLTNEGLYYRVGPASQTIGGVVLFFAVPRPGETVAVDWNRFWRDDVSFMPSYAAAPQDNATALELIRSRRVVVNDMITHRLSLDKIGEGFRQASAAEHRLKVIIQPND